MEPAGFPPTWMRRWLVGSEHSSRVGCGGKTFPRHECCQGADERALLQGDPGIPAPRKIPVAGFPVDTIRTEKSQDGRNFPRLTVRTRESPLKQTVAAGNPS